MNHPYRETDMISEKSIYQKIKEAKEDYEIAKSDIKTEIEKWEQELHECLEEYYISLDISDILRNNEIRDSDIYLFQRDNLNNKISIKRHSSYIGTQDFSNEEYFSMILKNKDLINKKILDHFISFKKKCEI